MGEAKRSAAFCPHPRQGDPREARGPQRHPVEDVPRPDVADLAHPWGRTDRVRAFGLSSRRLVHGFYLEQLQSEVLEPVQGAVQGGLIRQIGSHRGAAGPDAHLEVFERVEDGRDGFAGESDLVSPGSHVLVTICGRWRSAVHLRLLSRDPRCRHPREGELVFC
jgi:hypothetical protein